MVSRSLQVVESHCRSIRSLTTPSLSWVVHTVRISSVDDLGRKLCPTIRLRGTNLEVKSGAVTDFVALKTSVLTTPTFFYKVSGLSLFSELFGAVCDLQYEWAWSLLITHWPAQISFVKRHKLQRELWAKRSVHSDFESHPGIVYHVTRALKLAI